MADPKNEKAKAPAKDAKAGAPKDSKAVAKDAKAPKGEKKAKSAASPAVPKDYKPRFRKLYDEQIREALTQEFGYKNALEVPRIEKIVLNMGVGEAVNDTKKVATAAEQLAMIAGQKPVVTRARMPIGAKVTLRSTRMYEFLDRLVTIALPRVRDFRGLNPKSFDGRGNYAMGVKEHIVFPEIDYDKVESVLGMDIIVCTTAKTDAEARALLRAFNFPFRQ